MLIVAGSLRVDPAGRDAYLADCRAVVEQARTTTGCLDFALSPDLVDPGRINVHERWEGEAELLAFRGSGPSSAQTGLILGATVRSYVVTDEPAP